MKESGGEPGSTAWPDLQWPDAFARRTSTFEASPGHLAEILRELRKWRFSFKAILRAVLIRDVLARDLRVVFCGTALGARSAQVGAYYAGRGNQFWMVLHEIGLTPVVLRPDEYERVLDYGVGLTDICKTKSGSDEQVGCDAFDVPRLRASLKRWSPAWIGFNGKNAARAALGRRVDYGEQSETLAGVRCFVLPSTSGAARGYWDIEAWRALAKNLPSWP